MNLTLMIQPKRRMINQIGLVLCRRPTIQSHQQNQCPELAVEPSPLSSLSGLINSASVVNITGQSASVLAGIPQGIVSQVLQGLPVTGSSGVVNVNMTVMLNGIATAMTLGLVSIPGVAALSGEVDWFIVEMKLSHVIIEKQNTWLTVEK